MKIRHYALIVILGVLFLGLITGLKWMRPYDLATERATARAAGIPLTPEEFPQPTCSPSENAISDYAALARLLKAKPLDTKAIEKSIPRGAGGTIPRDSTGLLKTLVASRPDVARLVHAAAAKPHAYASVKWSSSTVFPQYAHMRTSATWLRWESLLLARQGLYAQAVENQALALRIARQSAEDPVLIGYLVSVACEVITMQGFTDILTESGPNAAVAEAVRRKIAAYDPGRNLSQCLKGEMLFGLDTLHSLKSLQDMRPLAGDYLTGEGAGAKPSTGKPNGLIRRFFLEPSEAIYIHWMTLNIQASGLPEPRRGATMAKVQMDFEAVPKAQPTYLYASRAMPVYARAGERDVSAEAQRNLVSAMASVMAYRARIGRWPETLGEAGTPVPMDPYTRKALGYRQEGRGFAVFAIPETTGEDAKGAKKLREWNTLRYPRRETRGPENPRRAPMPAR